MIYLCFQTKNNYYTLLSRSVYKIFSSIFYALHLYQYYDFFFKSIYLKWYIRFAHDNVVKIHYRIMRGTVEFKNFHFRTFSENVSFSRDVTFTLSKTMSASHPGIGTIRLCGGFYTFLVDVYDLPTLQGRIVYERGDRHPPPESNRDESRTAAADALSRGLLCAPKIRIR